MAEQRIPLAGLHFRSNMVLCGPYEVVLPTSSPRVCALAHVAVFISQGCVKLENTRREIVISLPQSDMDVKLIHLALTASLIFAFLFSGCIGHGGDTDVNEPSNRIPTWQWQ